MSIFRKSQKLIPGPKDPPPTLKGLSEWFLGAEQLYTHPFMSV